MWFPPRSDAPGWSAALAHLAVAEPVLPRLIACVGPCTLAPRRDYFVSLAQAIFTQQISTPVAAVLFARFRKLFPAGRPTPAGTLALSEAQLRSVGLSRQKIGYLRDLAAHFAAGKIPTRRFRTMPDDEIIASLLPVRGVGRWTAEMFLIFSLNRPDVFPIDDLGVRQGAQRAFGLPEIPRGQKLITLAEPWRPYRTIATWYLWRWAALREEPVASSQ